MTQTTTTAEDIARFELERTLVAMGPLAQALEMVPEDRLAERPVPEQYPVGQMIAHAFSAVAMCSRAVRLGRCEEADIADIGSEEEAAKSKEGIRAVADTARRETEGLLAELDDEALTRNIDFFFGHSASGLDTVAIGYGELLHHRGQVQSFLRVMGFEPPNLYGEMVEQAE